MLDLIKSRKKSGKKAPVRQEEEKPSNVINLFDALKKSLAAGKEGSGDGKPAAKKPAAKSSPDKKPPSGRRKS